MDVNVAMTTNRNTTFTYINGSVASATSNQFIKFVDKTPRRTIQDSIQVISYYEQIQQKRQAEEEQKTDIRLNILVDATPDAPCELSWTLLLETILAEKVREIFERNFIIRVM